MKRRTKKAMRESLAAQDALRSALCCAPAVATPEQIRACAVTLGVVEEFDRRMAGRKER